MQTIKEGLTPREEQIESLREMIQKRAYDKYILHWMINHEVSFKDFINKLDEIVEEQGVSVNDAVKIFELHYGFERKIYYSFEEFLDNEYLDKKFMESILNDYEAYIYNTYGLEKKRGRRTKKENDMKKEIKEIEENIEEIIEEPLSEEAIDYYMEMGELELDYQNEITDIAATEYITDEYNGYNENNQFKERIAILTKLREEEAEEAKDAICLKKEIENCSIDELVKEINNNWLICEDYQDMKAAAVFHYDINADIVEDLYSKEIFRLNTGRFLLHNQTVQEEK